MTQKKQIHEILQRYDLISAIKPFSRCMECNQLLNKIGKQAIVGHLDKEIAETFDDFFHCQNCQKFYWKGSHHEHMKKVINGIINEFHSKKNLPE